MSQLILGVHSGSHDAAAALFEDYELKAAISLERLTRNKGDGTRHPDLAIDEVLSIAGAHRRDVDVVCYSRSLLPTRHFRHLHGLDWLKEQYRTHIARKDRRQLMPELFRHHTANTDEFFDVAAFQREGNWVPRIEAVAQRLRCQPRRLRRDLAREGESFQHIRTRLRGEVAGALLLATDMPVTNIGYEIGFGEPGSFTRNFTEWAAMTPSEYRRRYRFDRARVATATTLVNDRREPWRD